MGVEVCLFAPSLPLLRRGASFFAAFSSPRAARRAQRWGARHHSHTPMDATIPTPTARSLLRAAVRAVHPDRFATVGGGVAATNARSLQVR